MINTKNILKIGVIIVILIFVLPVIVSRLYLSVVSEVGYIGIITTFKENTSRDRMLNILGWLSRLSYQSDIEKLGKIDNSIILEFNTREERNQRFLQFLPTLKDAQAKGIIEDFWIESGIPWSSSTLMQHIPDSTQDAYPTKFFIDFGVVEAQRAKIFLEENKLFFYANTRRLLEGGYVSARIDPPIYLEGPAYLFLKIKDFINPHIKEVYYIIGHLE